MNDETDAPDLRDDDPRLSEWIDGRLPAAEAEAVARRVAASPELTRVAADLRRLKALLAASPAAPLPAGFVADVLAALDAPPRLAPGTTAGAVAGPVDAEWERIELERIAGEIAEAREDEAVAETTAEPRQRWPWMTMAAALAAGVLVAAFINMPPLHSVLVDKNRDVALLPQEPPQDGLARSLDAFFSDEKEVVAEPERSPLGRAEAAKQSGDAAVKRLARDPSAPATEGKGNAWAADTAATAGGKPLVVPVRGPRGRAEFAALLAARDIRIQRAHEGREQARKRRGSVEMDRAEAPGAEPRKASANTELDVLASAAKEKDKDKADEFVEITGSPAAIRDLVAALGGARYGQAALRSSADLPTDRSADLGSLRARAALPAKAAPAGAQEGAPPAKPGASGLAAGNGVPTAAAESHSQGGGRTAGVGGGGGPGGRDGENGDREGGPQAEPRQVTLLVRLVDIGPGTEVGAKPAEGLGAGEEAEETGQGQAGGRQEP
jgi:hypothetical protein